MDVLGLGLSALSPALVEEVITALPRHDFKRAFFDVLVRAVARSTANVPHTWMMDIARHHVDGFTCVDFDEAIAAAPFE